jgi:hypothetical protein
MEIYKQPESLSRPGQCWFPTLNEALDSEALTDCWPLGVNLSYGETVGLSAGGRWISVTRDEQGRYERPIHYVTKVPDTYPRED